MFLLNTVASYYYPIFFYITIEHICLFPIIKMRIALNYWHNICSMLIIKIICDITYLFFQRTDTSSVCIHKNHYIYIRIRSEITSRI